MWGLVFLVWPIYCPKCDKNFDSDKLRVYKCPDCKASLQWDANVQVSDQVPEGASKDDLVSLDKSTVALVVAQNQTTFAIRSLGLYLFILTITSTLGGAMVLIGFGLQQGGWGSFGYFFVGAGFLVAVEIGANELSKSKVH